MKKNLPKQLSQLKAAGYNPRKISDEALAGLSYSIAEFGDLSTITYNIRTGNLVAGHQRSRVLTEKYGDLPIKDGKIVTPEGEFPIRFVDWDLNREKAANIAANSPTIQGDFTVDVGGILRDISDELPDTFKGLNLSSFADSYLKDETESDSEEEIVPIFSDKEILNDAYDYFKRTSFPFPKLELHEMKQELNRLIKVPSKACLHSTIGYGTADTYHPHRWKCRASGTTSPYDAYHNERKLRKALEFEFKTLPLTKKMPSFLRLVDGTQTCSNFRPAFAKMLYNEYAPEGGKVFDPCTGYGGRLVGFIASHCKEYYGSDPNVQTHKGNEQLAKDLNAGKKITLFNQPFEDVDIKKLKGKIDMIFTSPPYFSKEIYSSDNNQSCHRYKEYDEWRDKFLKVLIEKSYAMLKPKSYCILNIEDVVIKEVKYPLVKDTIGFAISQGFKYKETRTFPLSARTTKNAEGENVFEKGEETVLVFQR